MEIIATRFCPICGESKCYKIAEHSMFMPIESRLPNTFNVVTCTKCGFGYADTCATQEDYSHYYKNCNMYVGKASVMPKREQYFMQFIEFKDNSSVLDIGCGAGGLLMLLKQKNKTLMLTGCDPSADAVEALAKNDITSFQYDITQPVDSKYKELFDYVILTGVLEHLYTPLTSIENAKQFLKPDGEIILVLPDHKGGFQRFEVFDDLINHEHINYFSSTSLQNLLTNANLHIEECRSYIEKGATLHTFTFGSALFAKATKKQIHTQQEYDTGMKEAIEVFLAQEKFKQELRSAAIMPLYHRKEPICIWGTGTLSKYMLENTHLQNCNIIAFIDNDSSKTGHTFLGKPIVSPQDFMDTYSNTCEKIVIISGYYVVDIIDQLRMMGCKNKVLCIN